MTLAKVGWWERKLSHHQRRYRKTCETLARVRWLSVNVQVNIGQHQTINSGQTSAEPKKT